MAPAAHLLYYVYMMLLVFHVLYPRDNACKHLRSRLLSLNAFWSGVNAVCTRKFKRKTVIKSFQAQDRWGWNELLYDRKSLSSKFHVYLKG